MPVAERREHLLDAALALLDREGYAALTVEAIVREADVTRPVFYAAYDNLEHFLNALLDRTCNRALDQATHLLNTAGDPRDVDAWLLNAVAGLIDLVQEDPQVWRPVLGVTRESDARSSLAQSPSAWSLQLGALVAVACLLVSGLGLVIAGTASWAARTRDLAVVRMNGLPARAVRQIALGEQVPAVVAGGVVGALAGVIAAHFSLREVPLLPSPPPVDLLDLSVDWPLVALLAGAAVLTGALLGWLLGLLTARRAGVDRVLEAS